MFQTFRWRVWVLRRSCNTVSGNVEALAIPNAGYRKGVRNGRVRISDWGLRSSFPSLLSSSFRRRIGIKLSLTYGKHVFGNVYLSTSYLAGFRTNILLTTRVLVTSIFIHHMFPYCCCYMSTDSLTARANLIWNINESAALDSLIVWCLYTTLRTYVYSTSYTNT